MLGQQGYDGPDLNKLATKLNDRRQLCTELQRAKNEIASDDITVARLREIQQKYLPASIDNAPVLLELLFAYRRAAAWNDMVDLVPQMPDVLRKAVLVQEQYGMALGRLDDFSNAEQVLNGLINMYGPTALTFCFLGVVRKLRLLKALKGGESLEAQGALNNAIEAFVAAFKLDSRMIFAGINTVLLMHVRDPLDQKLKCFLPVVRYYINDAMATGKAAFWEHAAALEMAVLDDDQDRASRALDLLQVDPHEPWMPKSTLTDLALLRERREKRSGGRQWYAEVEAAVRQLPATRAAST